jgi:hypothetical protein
MADGPVKFVRGYLRQVAKARVKILMALEIMLDSPDKGGYW